MDNEHFWYLDAVEEALCFGWIDSTIRMISGKAMQRFSPRRATSGWTELNKERVRRLEKLGLMTDAGRAVLPPMGLKRFNPDKEVVAALKAARVWSNSGHSTLYINVSGFQTSPFVKSVIPLLTQGCFLM